MQSNNPPGEPAPRLAWLEALRAVASVSVILYHISRHLRANLGATRLAAFFQFGHAGVDLFFVLSGFVILFVHDRDIGQPRRFGPYAARRLIRIYPIYWVATAITVLGAAAGGHHWPALKTAIVSCLLLPSAGEPILGVAWTLKHEMLFYAVFGLLIISRAAGLAILSLWSLLNIAAPFFPDLAHRLPPPILSPYNAEFALGMGGAAFVLTVRDFHPGRFVAAGIALFCAAAMAEDLAMLDGHTSTARLAYGVASVLAVTGAAGLSRMRLAAPPRLLIRLGVASYASYLFQFVFIGLIWKAVSHAMAMAPVPVLFILLAAAAIVGGMAMSIKVEQPLLRRLRGLIRP